MRLAAAAPAAAVIFFALSIAHASFADPPPSLEELRSKSTKELKAILKSKGAKCKNCLEKDDFVHKVRDTWFTLPKQAKSPDGKIEITKEMFVKQLKESYGKHLKEEKQQPDSDDEDEDDSGHSLETDEAMPGMPDFDQVWADFSEKLMKGEIEKDDSGNLMYQVNDGSMGWSALWERYKMHIMLALNLGLLWFSQRLRKAKKEKDEIGKEKKDDSLRNEKESSGPEIMELDDDEDEDMQPGGGSKDKKKKDQKESAGDEASEPIKVD
jgi:hypothetical protein